VRLTRVYIDAPLAAGTEARITGDAVLHLTRVLRLGPGDLVVAFDGRGGEYQGEIAATGRAVVHVRLLSHDPIERESPLALTLVQALARGEKMDLVVQKASELGAVRIVPVATERSVVALSTERGARRLAHWRAVATAACEQCGRNRVPEIVTPVTFFEALARPANGRRVLLEPSGTATLDAVPPVDAAIEVWVGPEGGFSDPEIAAARRSGAATATCGPRVLRTETAAIAALALLQGRYGDLSRGC
jgi:16S rRNA (uracil1498-N3)-methyltransferase